MQNVSDNFMTTSEHIKTSLKKYKLANQKINHYNYNVHRTSLRLFKFKDEKGNRFKVYDFSDKIMVETKLQSSIHFAINQPDLICSANTLLENNIYTGNTNNSSVLVCVDLIKQDIQEIRLQKSEGLFVYSNAIQLLVDKSRELISEIAFLQKIKSIIEDKFPSTPEIVDNTKVPNDLQELIPLLKEWAISDDSERDEKIKISSKAKLQKVIDIVNPKMTLIDDYLDTFGDEPVPHEATLIMSLAELVAELTIPKSRI